MLWYENVCVFFFFLILFLVSLKRFGYLLVAIYHSEKYRDIYAGKNVINAGILVPNFQRAF